MTLFPAHFVTSGSANPPAERFLPFHPKIRRFCPKKHGRNKFLLRLQAWNRPETHSLQPKAKKILKRACNYVTEVLHYNCNRGRQFKPWPTPKAPIGRRLAKPKPQKRDGQPPNVSILWQGLYKPNVLW